VSRYARRTDENHALVRDGLRRAGFDVLDLSGAGAGVPDLLVRIGVGKSHHIEVKDGDKPKSAQALTKAQEDWWKFAHCDTSIVTSLEEAIEACTWAKARWTAMVLAAGAVK
jgi:hypothetical protein